jgi:phage terminase large subunit GpA-like protein
VQEREHINPETGLVVPFPSNARPGVVGVSAWAGMNPMLSRNAIVSDWLDAKRKGMGAIKAFTQHMLGRAWEQRSAYVEVAVNTLERNCVRYPAEIPNDVLFITAWWDAQEGMLNGMKTQRIEGMIVGWGLDDTPYFIAYHVIDGKLTTTTCRCGWSGATSTKPGIACRWRSLAAEARPGRLLDCGGGARTDAVRIRDDQLRAGDDVRLHRAVLAVPRIRDQRRHQ